MAVNRSLLLRAILSTFLAGFAASTTFISGCPVNFEYMNYTIITSRCKGPQYPPTLCCAAFKEFACPYVDEINDGSNECASTMFSYINIYGKYPPGLFASECKEGKLGLECLSDPPQSANDPSSGSRTLLQLVITVPWFVIVFLSS